MIGIIVIGIELVVFLVYAIYAVSSNQPNSKEMLFGWIIAFITIGVVFLIMYSSDHNYFDDWSITPITQPTWLL